MDILVLYLWTRLDHLNMLFGAIIFGAAVVIVMAFIFSPIWGDEEGVKKIVFKWFPRMGWLVAFCAVASVVIPTKTDVALIVAGTATYRAMTSEKGSRIATAFADYIEEQALSLLEKKAKK